MYLITNIKNIGKWILFIFESIIFLLIPSCIAIPYSLNFMINPNMLVIAELNNKERSFLTSHIIRNGLASLYLLFGFVFGCLGQFGPQEVFNYDDIVSNILNRRLRKLSRKLSNKIGNLKQQLIYKGFHEDCIIEWINEYNECPICKNDKFEDCVEYLEL
jgi:hypothetical protein